MTSREEGKGTYREFASTITFFSFLDIEEFHPSNFKSERYRTELDALHDLDGLTVESLAAFLVEHPRVVSIFSRLIRDQRFSNTQIAHFCFDLEVLNSDNLPELEDRFLLHYSNVDLFRTHVDKELAKLHAEGIIGSSDVNALECVERVVLLKRAVQRFCSKDEYLIRILPLPAFADASLRTARYLIENVWLDRFLGAMDVEAYLLAKRRVRDTKGLHGDFGSSRVARVLEGYDVACVDDALGSSKVLRVGAAHPDLRSNPEWEGISSGWTYATERFIDGIIKPKDGKNKQFDYVLLRRGVPEVVIETNFYTTVGTKIEINVTEYVDVLHHIRDQGIPVHFIWITDGPSWLETSQRRLMVDTLIPTFGEHLMNYRMFDRYLDGLLRG